MCPKFCVEDGNVIRINMTTCPTSDLNERLEMLKDWLQGNLESPVQRVLPLPGDASFRRYFRVYCGNSTYVAMDAPPEKESCKPFVAIARSFYKLGLNVPVIYAEDIKRGFLLLTDFGDQLYLDALTPKTCHNLYQKAFDDLLLIQSCHNIEDYVLPKFDAALYIDEMSWFRDWYLQHFLKVSLSNSELAALDHIYSLLIDDALSQPQVCVHRDYHSRNLMVVNKTARPGILDFQGAVWGPITYDLLSLLRDCYIDWPPEQIEKWVLAFHKQVLQAGLLQEENPKRFLRWFDWIGLQRNLKCIGIFARLNERDHKPAYLQYIPRVIKYAKGVCDRYPAFADLKLLLNKK